MAIEDIDDLQDHLRRAIYLEHSTIPLYLYAYYSIENPLSDAAQSMRSVVMQEMLHLSLATNLLTATGQTHRFDDPATLPAYPLTLPHHEPSLVLHLERATVDLVRDVFCAIERPMTVRDIPESGDYTTIGQFYAAIDHGFRHLTARLGAAAVFTGDPRRQLTTGYVGGYAGATGAMVGVFDLPSARAAIREIVRQGEGTSRSEDDGTGELAHYWLFNQIVDHTAPLGGAYPVVTDPRTADLPGGDLRDLSQLFDDGHGLLLRLMTAVFSDDPSPGQATRDHLAATLVPVMVRILKPIAMTLMRTPIPGRAEHAGPAFGYSDTPQGEILAAAERLSAPFPELAPVVQALRYLPTIDAPVPSGASR